MATNANDIIPARATHPGSVLKRELQARGIKQKDFAVSLGMPASNLSELIKGKRHVTEAIAIKLEELLGIPYDFWMNLQSRYHYVDKRLNELNAIEAEAAAEEQSLTERVNLKALYRYFNIICAKASERLAALKTALNVDLSGLKALEDNTIGFFKRSEKVKVDNTNMRTWLLIAWSEASRAVLNEEFTPEKGLSAATEIAQMANAGTITVNRLEEVLNRNGIIFLHIPKLEAAPIDAYSMMAGAHPVIVATFRYNDLDKLTFDVLHEVGHILYHLQSGKSFIAVESDAPRQSREEKEADQFANDMLIAPEVWQSIMAAQAKNLSPYAVAHAIAAQARRHGISSSIAMARYKHDTRCYNIPNYRSPKIC